MLIDLLPFLNLKEEKKIKNLENLINIKINTYFS